MQHFLSTQNYEMILKRIFLLQLKLKIEIELGFEISSKQNKNKIHVVKFFKRDVVHLSE